MDARLPAMSWVKLVVLAPTVTDVSSPEPSRANVVLVSAAPPPLFSVTDAISPRMLWLFTVVSVAASVDPAYTCSVTVSATLPFDAA